MAPPVAWQTHPPQRSPEVPVKGLRARPEGRPGHGRLGVAHTEVTGFTCRGAGRSPSGVPCLPRQRIKGFESRSEQDDSYICGSICDAERESHEEPARAHHGARRGHAGGHADLPGGPASPRPNGRGGSGALSPGPSRAGSCGSTKGSYMRPMESRFGRCAPGIEKSPQALSELWGETIVREPANPNGRPNSDVLAPWMNGMAIGYCTAATWSTSGATATACAAMPSSPRPSTRPPPGPSRRSARNTAGPSDARRPDPFSERPAPVAPLPPRRVPKVSHFRWPLTGKLRDELSNGEIFYSLAEAAVLVEQWRREYNTVRPHSACGGFPPAPEAIKPSPWFLRMPVLHGPPQVLGLT